MGICIIEFNDNWRDDLATLSLEFQRLLIHKIPKDEFARRMKKTLSDIDSVLSNIIQLKWFNVVNLVSGVGIKKSSTMDRTRQLKTLLTTITDEFGVPDVVLIEYQMKQNDLSRSISHQIAYHFTTNANADHDNITVSFAVREHALALGTSDGGKDIGVEMVGTSLKNSYYIAPDGIYSNFIVKYTNYTANKKHCTHNFKYYMQTFQPNFDLKTIANKLDDIADAFMMSFAWLKEQQHL